MFPRSFILLFFIITAPLLTWAQSYEQSVNEANNFIKAVDFVSALTKAQKAILLKPNGFEGYYFAAYALYKKKCLHRLLRWQIPLISMRRRTGKPR